MGKVSLRKSSPPLAYVPEMPIRSRQKASARKKKRNASNDLDPQRPLKMNLGGKTTGLADEDLQQELADPTTPTEKIMVLTEKDLQEIQQQYKQMTEEDWQAWNKLGELKAETRQYRSRIRHLHSETATQHEESDADNEGFGITGDGNESDVQQQSTTEEEQKTGEDEAKTDEVDEDPQVFEDGDPGGANEDYNHDRQVNVGVNTQMRDSFKEYCDYAQQHMLPNLTKTQVQAVKLVDILRKKKAPMDTYDGVMLWHYQNTGELGEDEQLGDSNTYISRKKLIKDLTIRYNMQDKFPETKPLVLPFTKSRVDLVCHNAWGCMESLLTDPRLTDDDFWFFDNDPRAPPPENNPHFADLYTGRAYREAAKKYKKHPDQIPLPIVMYLDGADTGQMKSMPINALKMTLGIFTRAYRDRDHAWRVLGHVANVSKAKSRAKRTMHQSGHIASLGGAIAEGEGTDPQGIPVGDSSGSIRDLHAMLDVLLEGYQDIQKRGFKWDLRYRGKTYKDLEFIPFVIFIKCDTKEANLLCGQYQGAKSDYLCRYCFCPSAIADDPSAKDPFRTVKWVRSFSDNNDFQGARRFSQHNFPNAFHRIRFSPENDRGIHGACPSEMLHAVLLGNFAYLRDTLYEQVGESSQLAETIDKLSLLYGSQFSRQSERSMPKCKFTNGIREGKLNAKEYRGILLVMAAIFRCTEGRNSLSEHSDFTKQHMDNWAELCEIMLTWETFLCQPQMSARAVSRLSSRNRLIMWMIKKIAGWKKGMGLKIMKFHAIVHMAWDIILYGVPMEFDTGSNESGHKLTKTASKMTQKNRATFDHQTATRIAEFQLIDLAMEEVAGRKLWDYYDNPSKPLELPLEPAEESVTGDTTINIFEDADGNPCYSLGVGPKSRVPASKPWSKDVVVFLHQLQIKLRKWIPKLEIRCVHKRNNQIFRGHPDYRGGYWRDWVRIDWGDGLVLPALIWCFVVLRDLPKSNKKKEKHKTRLNHGFCQLEDGVFAAAESANYVKLPPNSTKKSMLFRKLKLDMSTRNGVRRRKFYLVDTEAFKDPSFVIPDFGCQDRCTFHEILGRDYWAEAFEEWMEKELPQEYKDNPCGDFGNPE